MGEFTASKKSSILSGLSALSALVSSTATVSAAPPPPPPPPPPPATGIADQIKADMASPGDALAHGIETWPQSRGGWAGLIGGLRQENALPSGWTSGTAWGQIYRASPASSAPGVYGPVSDDVNTRVAIADFYVYLFNKTTKTWVRVQGPNFDGGKYIENYATNSSLGAGLRTESDGSRSVLMTKGYNFHFYPNGRWNLLNSVAAADLGGFYAYFKARKVLDNAGGTDDRAIAKYLMNVGGDWWKTPSIGYGGGAVNNREIGFSRFKYVTDEWQTVRVCTLLDPDVAKWPPPQ